MFDLLRESGDIAGLSVIVGGAYCTLGRPLSLGTAGDAAGPGAAGAGRNGTIGEETPTPGGLGAGRCGRRAVPFGCGDSGGSDRFGVLLGIGGGARGFSKLS